LGARGLVTAEARGGADIHRGNVVGKKKHAAAPGQKRKRQPQPRGHVRVYH